MKSVGIDGQIFALQNYGGISRYFSTLLDQSISSQGTTKTFPLFVRHRNAYLSDLGVGTYDPQCDASHLISGGMHLDSTSKMISYQQPDIVHTTYYVGQHPKTQLPNGCQSRFVSSLYDMIPENYPAFFPNGNPHHNKLEWLEKSDIIISISNSAASDLLDIRPHLASRIRVIHLGTDMNLKDDIIRPSSVAKQPYFLFVGFRRGYKNSTMLLRAFSRSLPRLRRHQLIFAGGGLPNNPEKQLIKDLGIEENVIFCQPNDKQLKQLYYDAIAVVIPSFAEGFSLPLIESLAADTPIICSDIPVHKEVGEKYCYFVNPTNTEEWASILAEYMNISKPSEILGSTFEMLCNYYSSSRMISEHYCLYEAL